MAFRFITLTAFFALLFGVLGFGLYQLQVERGFYYFEKARARAEVAEKLNLRRGRIFFTDRNGNEIPVALNKDFPVIYAVPKEIKDLAEAVEILSSITGLDKSILKSSLENSQALFRLLVEKATVEQIQAVYNSNLDGVYVGKKQYRVYPYNTLASQLIGFVGLNEKNKEPTGLYGVEKLYNEELAAGKDIHLTIDHNLQVAAEETLIKLISNFQATAGTIIIGEPQTGKILTMASKPDFDPNNYKDSPLENFLNPAVQHMYEPGSVFKPLTMAAGIDKGVLTPETTFFDTGEVTFNGKTIRNWDMKAYGKVTMTNVIEKSINTGAVYAQKLIGNEAFTDYLKKFGFGEKTSIDLPDEVAGSIKNLESKNASQIDFATASFGQGTAVTPIQLVAAFGSLASDGLLMRPYINADSRPLAVRRVINESTAGAVTAMMESAVEKAKVAVIEGYRVAGKTGTAYIPNFKLGGYTDELIHTYIGFAPVSTPRFIILIKLDKPQRGELAGITVVPSFRELMQLVLNYYNVLPDKL